MSDTFFNKSKEIANNYIQSIVFLDDRAYIKNEKSDQSPIHDLSAEKISALFAKNKKICALYDPENESDINDFKEIALKADVVVLDWFIDLTVDLKEGENAEDDADDDDPRGKYTKEVIKHILKENSKEALKLIIVYTGETNLPEITEVIGELSSKLETDTDNCLLTSENIKVLVRAKNNLEEGKDQRFKHLVHLQDKVLTYEQLPDFILNEYTKLTTGLLSNFALLSLTTIRENSSKILGVFNNKLDAAYLGHKSVLPFQNDSEILLIELFGNSIIDLLKYKNVDKEIQTNLIEDFVQSIASLNLGKFERNSELLMSLLSSDVIDIKKRFTNILPNIQGFTKKEKQSFVINSTKLFASKNNDELISNIDKEFARITHQKNIFLPNETAPILSLGTVVKSTINENQYYICIQQRCDSVRINQGGERKFLFIPLSKIEDGKFNFLTTEGFKLKLDNNSFSLRTIKFGCDNTEGIIRATKENENYIFKQIYEGEEVEQFEWVLDLKDLHSQRIVDSYSSKLSRVGLDESEWLRRRSL